MRTRAPPRSRQRALEAAGASMLACAHIEEGDGLRESGITLPILVFGALSVSDLAGVFEARLTPTLSTPGAAARRPRSEAAADRGVRPGLSILKIDTGHEPPGLPPRQPPGGTMPEVSATARHLAIDAVYTHMATADDPESPFLDEQRSAVRSGGRGARPPMGLTFMREAPRRELGHAPPRRPSLVRLGPAGPAAVRHRATAAGRGRSRPATCPVTHEPYGGGEGCSSGRRRRLRPAVADRRTAVDWHRPRGIRRRARHATVGARLGTRAWPPCTSRWRGLDGHARGGRHRARRRARR